jgi:glyoxylase-like metal-dependent hydrolase (beta-lactamase superfamily II)
VAEIRRLTDLPVRYLVSTHWHGDHVQGNQSIREHFPDVRIIGHSSTIEDMRGAGRRRLDDDIGRIKSAIARDQKGVI